MTRRSTKSKMNKNEKSKNIPNLKIIEAVLVHCNIVKNDYQQDSRVLYTFVLNKLVDQFLDILPKNFIFL